MNTSENSFSIMDSQKSFISILKTLFIKFERYLLFAPFLSQSQGILSIFTQQAQAYF